MRFPTTDDGHAIKSSLTGRTYSYDITSRVSRREAEAALRADDDALAEATQARAQKEIGRKLTEREILKNDWLPDHRSKWEKEADSLASQNPKFNPYQQKLDHLEVIRRSLSEAEYEGAKQVLTPKAERWKAPTTEPQSSPYAAALAKHQSEWPGPTAQDRRAHERQGEVLKDLDRQHHAEMYRAKAEAERLADPHFVRARTNAECRLKVLQFDKSVPQKFVNQAAADLEALNASTDTTTACATYWLAESSMAEELHQFYTSVNETYRQKMAEVEAQRKEALGIVDPPTPPTLYDESQRRATEQQQ